MHVMCAFHRLKLQFSLFNLQDYKNTSIFPFYKNDFRKKYTWVSSIKLPFRLVNCCVLLLPDSIFSL